MGTQLNNKVRKRERVLSLILAAVMLFTVIPIGALVAYAESTSTAKHTIIWVSGTDATISGNHICECNGIRYVKLKHSNDLIKTAQSIKEAFRKCHTFFQTNDEEDIEILRTRFQNWRKQK